MNWREAKENALARLSRWFAMDALQEKSPIMFATAESSTQEEENEFITALLCRFEILSM